MVVFIHCGSRGLGHQVCQDYLGKMQEAMVRYGIDVPDKQLACAPVQSDEGRDYLVTPGETRRVVENQAVGWNPSITGTKSEDTILSSGEVLTEMKNWPVRGSRPDILCR